jgi:hypothetical protein
LHPCLINLGSESVELSSTWLLGFGLLEKWFAGEDAGHRSLGNYSTREVSNLHNNA